MHTVSSEFRSQLMEAVQLKVSYDHPGHQLSPDPATAASVLILFGFEKQHQILASSILFILRTEKVETHKGQVAFPGGVREAGEESTLTALRETEEEVGIQRQQIQIVGALPELFTYTGFKVTPIVGVLETPLSQTLLQPNADEIADTFWAPLEVLMHPDTYRREFHSVGAVKYPIHVYNVQSRRIWGITGTITKNLMERLSIALQTS